MVPLVIPSLEYRSEYGSADKKKAIADDKIETTQITWPTSRRHLVSLLISRKAGITRRHSVAKNDAND